VETCLWPTIDHLDPPDLPRHGCYSDRGPAASGGPIVLANDRNGGRLRLNASRHDDDDDDDDDDISDLDVHSRNQAVGRNAVISDMVALQINPYPGGHLINIVPYPLGIFVVSVLTDVNDCAKFHQIRLKVATTGAMKDRQT